MNLDKPAGTTGRHFEDKTLLTFTTTESTILVVKSVGAFMAMPAQELLEEFPLLRLHNIDKVLSLWLVTSSGAD